MTFGLVAALAIIVATAIIMARVVVHDSKHGR